MISFFVIFLNHQTLIIVFYFNSVVINLSNKINHFMDCIILNFYDIVSNTIWFNWLQFLYFNNILLLFYSIFLLFIKAVRVLSNLFDWMILCVGSCYTQLVLHHTIIWVLLGIPNITRLFFYLYPRNSFLVLSSFIIIPILILF